MFNGVACMPYAVRPVVGDLNGIWSGLFCQSCGRWLPFELRGIFGGGCDGERIVVEEQETVIHGEG